MGGKFSEAMKVARSKREEDVNTDLQKDVSNGLQNDVNTVLPQLEHSDDPLVSLTIKVSKSLRQHWQIETKKAGKTVTQEIITLLTERYGKPS